MNKGKIEIHYTTYDSSNELKQEDAQLLEEARKVTQEAYAPYSKFHVGTAAKLSNGKIVTGTNQENASFPAGICAERVLISTISSLYPGMAIEALAVSYKSEEGPDDHPISPCGVCRQVLCEYEDRVNQPIRLILGGMQGPVYVFEKAGSLLPLAFSGKELNKE